MKNEEVIKLNLKAWPLPDDYLIELGRVAALWGTLETFLNMCIGKLAGFNDINDAKPFILITHSSFPQRLDMLAALCEQLVDQFPNLKDYKAVVSQLRDAQKLRNDLMHYGMSVNHESGQVEMAMGSARGTVKVSIKNIRPADIRRATIAIHEAELALYKLILKKEIPPIWGKGST